MQQAEQKVKKCFSEESAACAQTQPLVSVIVAVYKVEPYVERCVRSIMEQTYRNLEIILVDDGSPDKSGEICDRLALEDARIAVYHQTNNGASAARNFGVSKSCGNTLLILIPMITLRAIILSDLFSQHRQWGRRSQSAVIAQQIAPTLHSTKQERCRSCRESKLAKCSFRHREKTRTRPYLLFRGQS